MGGSYKIGMSGLILRDESEGLVLQDVHSMINIMRCILQEEYQRTNIMGCV